MAQSAAWLNYQHIYLFGRIQTGGQPCSETSPAESGSNPK